MADWITRREVRDATAVATLRQNFDAGEAEIIILVLESKANLVLLAKQEKRHTVQHLRLHMVWHVGVLCEGEGRERDLVDRVQPFLDELRREAGFDNSVSSPMSLKTEHTFSPCRTMQSFRLLSWTYS